MIETKEEIIKKYASELFGREVEPVDGLILDVKTVKIIIDEYTNQFKEQPSNSSELEELRNWKKEALSVYPDMQEIGKLLGLKVGESISENIIPAIEHHKAFKSKIETVWAEIKLDRIEIAKKILYEALTMQPNKAPFCICLYEMENKLPSTQCCFIACEAQNEILNKRIGK